MRINSNADLVTLLLAVNIAALLVLTVTSYVVSVFVLDWLESLDRWLDTSQRKPKGIVRSPSGDRTTVGDIRKAHP